MVNIYDVLAAKEMIKSILHLVLARGQDEVFEKHCASWHVFWNNFGINVKGNLELVSCEYKTNEPF